MQGAKKTGGGRSASNTADHTAENPQVGNRGVSGWQCSRTHTIMVCGQLGTIGKEGKREEMKDVNS